MSKQNTNIRFLVVVGALLIQLALGGIYAWSVFSTPLVEAGWSSTDTQIVYSAGLALFAIVMVIAGRLMPKYGPRKLAIGGGIGLGLGYILAGAVDETSFWVLFVCIGIIGGSGIGLAYVVPIAVGMRWFPDKKGMITGIAVAGFGFGAMFWVKLAGEWGDLLGRIGLGSTFIVYGVLFFAIVTTGSIWMVFPPGGHLPTHHRPTPADRGIAPLRGSLNFESAAMLRTPQFYMIFLTLLISASAGLMSIGLMKLFPSQALESNGLLAERASAIAGTAMAVFFSLANGLGRIGWGIISDQISRKTSITVMMALQGTVMLLFPYMAGTPALLYLGAAMIGFNFGGNFALFPAITADVFGNKFVGQNYGWVFLAYGAGGIFGPVLGGRLGDLGDFPLAFTIVGGLCLAASTIIVALKPPLRSK